MNQPNDPAGAYDAGAGIAPATVWAILLHATRGDLAAVEHLAAGIDARVLCWAMLAKALLFGVVAYGGPDGLDAHLQQLLDAAANQPAE